jgi:hypothetical protein
MWLQTVAHKASSFHALQQSLLYTATSFVHAPADVINAAARSCFQELALYFAAIQGVPRRQPITLPLSSL